MEKKLTNIRRHSSKLVHQFKPGTDPTQTINWNTRILEHAPTKWFANTAHCKL